MEAQWMTEEPARPAGGAGLHFPEDKGSITNDVLNSEKREIAHTPMHAAPALARALPPAGLHSEFFLMQSLRLNDADDELFSN